jgi:hypothetical protein
MIGPVFQIPCREEFPNQVDEPIIGDFLPQDIQQAGVINALETFSDVNL